MSVAGDTSPRATVAVGRVLTEHTAGARGIHRLRKNLLEKLFGEAYGVHHLWLREFLCHRFLKSCESFLGKYYLKLALESCCWSASEKGC